jgi:hypothetical protein
MSKRMRLTLRKMIGSSLQFRRYDHQRHGVIETLTQNSVVYVRPVFGLLKTNKPQQGEVDLFRARKPRAKPARIKCKSRNTG